MKILPITKIILQADGTYYSFPWDGTAGINIEICEGAGIVSHGGVDYLIIAADSKTTAVVPDVSKDAPYIGEAP